MIHSELPTYEVNIFLGLRCGYSEVISPAEDIRKLCDKFVERGLCVTIQELDFIYTGGREPGVKIGLINYPRFPKSEDEVYNTAIELAELLIKETNQFRCTVITPKSTYLLENKDMSRKFEDRS